jgi:hypothetical protein
MSGLSWMLPVSSVGFFVFVGTAVVLAVIGDAPIWLLAAIALPGIPFIWLGLMLALIDVTRRPKDQIAEESRIIWVLAICLLNAFVFIPYWLIVVRRNPPVEQSSQPPVQKPTPEAAQE